MTTRPNGLAERDRRHARASAFWSAAALAAGAGYVLVVLADDWLDFSALLGVDRHHVWVFLSEGLPVPVFLGGLTAWAVSCAYGLPLVQRRPVCLAWVAGVPALALAAAAALVAAIAINSR